MPRPPRLVVRVCLILGSLAVAGCTAPPPRPDHPEIGFQDRPPIRLDVREVAVEQSYRPPYAAPNVEHLFPVPPAAAAARWANERLVAAGPTRRARYNVRQASVLETPLERSGGLKGAFTTEQSERYDARLVVELEIISEDGRSEGSLTAEVERSRSVPENLTVNERETVWHEMTRTMLDELDRRLEETIKRVFFKYLIL